MYRYRISGRIFVFPDFIDELTLFGYDEYVDDDIKIFVRYVDEECFSLPDSSLLSSALGWIGGENRLVEIWSTPLGFLLKVKGGSDFYIATDGQTIIKAGELKSNLGGVNKSSSTFSLLDRETLLGLVLVLTLALNEISNLHASAAVFAGQPIAFLGDSGQGKSTLAAFLGSQQGWERLADDILPVKQSKIGLDVLPHFPQLKLPADNQPGFNFPEQLPLDKVCLLEKADVDAAPELQRLPPNQAVRVLLGHTAGSKLFSPDLLAKHLEFCARAAERIPIYRLIYPHRKDVLPEVKEILESIC